MGLVATFIALLLYCCGWNGGHSVASCGYGCPFITRSATGGGPVHAGAMAEPDGSWTAVVWGHLLWVMPWMLLSCNPPGSALIHG